MIVSIDKLDYYCPNSNVSVSNKIKMYDSNFENNRTFITKEGTTTNIGLLNYSFDFDPSQRGALHSFI